MAEKTTFTDGEPCWIDVMVRDPEASRRFYESIFGWTYEVGGEETGGYTMCLSDGEVVAGLSGMMPEAGDASPCWSLYFAASDVDAVAAKVKASGGSLVVEPMDVLDVGRMLFGFDSTGATFGAWQAREHPGFARDGGRCRGRGGFVWAELNATDPSAADAFYQRVFGFGQRQIGDGANFDYSVWSVGDRDVVGRARLAGDQAAGLAGFGSHWLIYLNITDVDAACERVAAGGGEIQRPPHDSPHGRFATVADPDGAVFNIIDQSRATGPEAA